MFLWIDSVSSIVAVFVNKDAKVAKTVSIDCCCMDTVRIYASCNVFVINNNGGSICCDCVVKGNNGMEGGIMWWLVFVALFVASVGLMYYNGNKFDFVAGAVGIVVSLMGLLVWLFDSIVKLLEG